MRTLPLLLVVLLAGCSVSSPRDGLAEPTLEGVLNKRNYALGAHVISHGLVVDLTNPIQLPGREKPVSYVALLVYPEQAEFLDSMLGKSVVLKCKVSATAESEQMYAVVFCPSTGLVAP